MSSLAPFGLSGRFYRGSLHMHSTRSDGALEVAAALAAYSEHGYDFASLTDHFIERFGYPIVDTRAHQTERFVTIPGAELHAPAIEAGEAWHIVAIGLPLDFAPPHSSETGPALAARAREAGAFVGIAHPNWSGLTLKDALSLDAAHAVEIYNHGCQVEVDRGDSLYMSDMLSLVGRRLTCYAADDAHFKEPDYHGGWVMVRAPRLEPAALVDALKAGHYYSSQGPEIHDVRIEGDRLHVVSSAVQSIIVTGVGSKSERVTAREPLTEATFSLGRFSGSFFRVTVIDASGRRAWTSPAWLA